MLDPIAAPARPGGRVGTPQQLTRWRLDTTRAPDWALCDAGYIGAIAQTAPAQAPLVGRDDELDLLLDTVGRVATAGLTAVVVSGEAGIGKSRLLAEARARLAGRGWRVLDVRADRLERRVPYAALAGALRLLAADSSFAEGLRRESLAALEGGTPEAAFGRACAAVARLATALAAAGPVAVVVDDLHELDDDSLALLAVVLRRLAAAPVALVAALRPHLAAPNPAAVEMLDRLDDVVRVDLGTLPAADLAAIVAPLLGAPPDDDLAVDLHRRADGNPFFAGEIARSLAESRLVALDSGRAHLTGEVRLTRRDTVLRRVVPLAPHARAVARTLAVLRTADLARVALIAEVTGLSEADVAAAFDDLVRAHVVTADAGRYRFGHDIVADALYDDIGPAECRRLHGLVADRMLAERARGGPVDLLELAWHVSASAVPGDTGAVAVLTEAAHHARAGAPEAAAAFCARALDLLPAGSPDRGPLLALRCRTLARASRPALAVPAGRQALALLAPGEDRDRTATALVSSLYVLGRVDDAIAVTDELLAAGPVPPSLRAQRAVLLAYASRNAQARAEAQNALAGAPASPAEQVVVYSQLAMLTSLLVEHDGTVRYADRALAASGASTTLQLQALAVCASTEALAGLVPDAAQRLRRASALAAQSGRTHLFPGELGVARVVLDWLGGRWDAALEGLRTVAADLETREHALLAAALTAIELDVRTWRGELVLAAKLAARPAPPMRNMADLYAVALARYLAATGDLDGARRTARERLDDPATAPYGCLLLADLIDLEREHGAAGEAAALVETLVKVATPQSSPWSRTTLARTVGTVHDDAVALARAVVEAEAGGLVFERARAQLALGDQDSLLAAYQTFARLGAHGLRRRTGRRLSELGAKVPRSRSRSSGLLTEGEERVARLVQQGMRNREIAAALHYSPRSIEVYLSRIYAKLRVSSRLELARALDALDAGG